MTDDLCSEVLSQEQVVWLASGELSPYSPLVSFAGLADAAEMQPPARYGFSDERWNQAVAVLRHPTTRIRVTIPGSTHSLVQYFLGGGPGFDGLVGCWIEANGLRVSFPWSEADVVSLVSQVVFSTPPETAEIEPLILSEDGLAALGATVDALRLKHFTAMAERRLEGDDRIDWVSLQEQNASGTESSDARWLAPMLRLTGLTPPVADDAIGRGVGELVESGLLVAAPDHWRPGPLLHTLAAWWRDPLPAISCETTQFDNGRVLQHEQRVIIRGSGPLCVLHRTGGPSSGRSITIGTIAPLDYFEEMKRAILRMTSLEPELVYVLEPTAVRDAVATTAVTGYLQPGRWYRVEEEAGAWVWVSDPSGPLEGWAPAAELYRRVDTPDEATAIEPAAVPLDPARPSNSVVPGPPPKPPPQQPPEFPPPPSPGRDTASSSRRRFPVIAGGAGAIAVIAAIAFAALSGSSDQDASASQSTPPAAGVTTTLVSTTAAVTTIATTTSTIGTTTTAAPATTAAAPVTLGVGYWFHSSVHIDRDDAGNLIGFEVDLVNDLMARMGAEAEWIEMDLMALYEGIETGQFDMAVGGLNTAAVRTRLVPFTIPYFERQWALIVDPRASPRVASFDELTSGDVVAVQRGTSAVDWSGATLEPRGVRVAIFGSPEDLRNALESGAAQAQVSSALYSLAAADRLLPRELADAVSKDESVGIAVDPGQPQLLADLNEHLAAMIEDGTYQAIYNRWFRDQSASVAPAMR